MISKNQIKYIRQLEQKKFRHREGLFVAEGTKVVGDLLAHYQPHSIFATPEWLSSNATEESSKLKDTSSKFKDPSSKFKDPSSKFKVNIVSPDELRRISFQQHPQQVLAIFPIPDSSYHKVESSNHKVESSNHKVPLELCSLATNGTQ